MIDQQQSEDFQESNESSLQMLVRAIELSQGEFFLMLTRCNYGKLRDRIIQRLREQCPVEIREISLKESVKTLYTTIQDELGNEKPDAAMVYGFELVSSLTGVLTSTNLVREEFSKNFPFLLVLWINDEVLKNLVQFAPDFWSWGVYCEFTMATDELIALLQENSERIFFKTLEAGDEFLPNSHILDSHYRQELNSAQKDLQTRHQTLEPALEASLQFIRGRDEYANDQIETALALYQQSLVFWQQSNNLEQQGILLFYIGLCYCRKADLQRLESYQYWKEARGYFEQCLDSFEQAQRRDLVAKFIGQLGKVLQRLEAWEDLQNLARKAIPLHETYKSPVRIARDYGFLAEVMLEKYSISGSDDLAREAEKLALQALQILEQAPKNYQHQGLYLLLLARSQRLLNQPDEAIANLKKAREFSIPQFDPLLHIRILKELRSLYYDRKQYLEAFEIKQEQGAIEQQYGFRAFIGATRLQPQKQGLRQEEPIFGREQDVKRLIDERISSQDKKLTVIHGLSGVGKSSIIDAGLVPVLTEKNIGDRKALPVLVRVYRDWLSVLGQALAQALKEIRDINLSTPPNSLAEITAQLQENNNRNLLTILIFDQFEEFFFVNTKQSERQEFYTFLKDCLNSVDIRFVRIILCLREDYMHNLLEYERLVNLDKIKDDLLSEKNRYYIGNFHQDAAKAVIQSLTERSQFYLESTLIDELVQELAVDMGEVRPIELQVVGAQLQAEGITSLAQYRERGPKAKLVQRYLEEAIKNCGLENERAAGRILCLLTDENNTRPLKTKAELKADVKLQDEQLNLVLEILEGSGLVFRIPEVPADRYQLVHDYLVPFIRQQQPLLQLEIAMRKLDEEELKPTIMQLEQLLQEATSKRIEQEQRQAEQVSKWIKIAENQVLNSLFQLQVISGFTDINRVFNALVDDLKCLREFSKRLGLEDSIKLLDEALKRIQKNSFSIAVIGEFKVGKTTLINALLGKKILPDDINPCTATINRVTYGITPCVKIIFKDGREEEIHIEKLPDYVTMLTPEAKETAASVKEAVVYYPVHYCQNNVDIIDTPGVNNIAEMTDIALSILPQVDVAIMVINAQTSFTSYQEEFLKTKLLRSDLGRIIFVLTAIDNLNKPGEADKALMFAQNCILKLLMERARYHVSEESPEFAVYQKKIGRAEVFAVSAYQALQAKLTGDTDLLAKSHFPEFEAALEKCLTQERGTAFLQVPVNRAIASAVEILTTISLKESTLAKKQEEFRVAYDKSVADLKAWRDRNVSVLKTIDATLQENEKPLKENGTAERMNEQIAQIINEQLSQIFNSLKQKVQQEGELLLENVQNTVAALHIKLEQEKALFEPRRQEFNQIKADTSRILGNAQRLSQQLIQQMNQTD